MNNVQDGKPVSGRPRQMFRCAHVDCGATFFKQRKLDEHGTVHTGAVGRIMENECSLINPLELWNWNAHIITQRPQRPCQCPVTGCERRFKRKSHLSRHMLQHRGLKKFQWVSDHLTLVSPLHWHLISASDLCRCKFASCSKTFFNADRLKRHVRYAHGEKNEYFKVPVVRSWATRWRQSSMISSAPAFISNHFVSSRSVTNPSAPWPSKNADYLNCI